MSRPLARRRASPPPVCLPQHGFFACARIPHRSDGPHTGRWDAPGPNRIGRRHPREMPAPPPLGGGRIRLAGDDDANILPFLAHPHDLGSRLPLDGGHIGHHAGKPGGIGVGAPTGPSETECQASWPRSRRRGVRPVLGHHHQRGTLFEKHPLSARDLPDRIAQEPGQLERRSLPPQATGLGTPSQAIPALATRSLQRPDFKNLTVAATDESALSPLVSATYLSKFVQASPASRTPFSPSVPV